MPLQNAWARKGDPHGHKSDLVLGDKTQHFFPELPPHAQEPSFRFFRNFPPIGVEKTSVPIQKTRPIYEKPHGLSMRAREYGIICAVEKQVRKKVRLK